MVTNYDMVADHQKMWNRFCMALTIAIVVVVVILGGLGLFLL